MTETDEEKAVLVIGCGEVGSALLEHLARRDVAVVAVDPARPSKSGPVPILTEIPRQDYGLVLACVPAAAAVAVARDCAGLPASPLHIDLSSSTREVMQAAAGAFGEPRFVDGAIMGSVALNGAATPLLLAGERAPEAERRLRRLGFSANGLSDSRPGDAGALKLLRSVVTKGLEAVAVEGFLAARRMGLLDRLRENLDDVGRPSFPEFLDTLVRTHVLHAPRRAAEVASVIGQLEEAGADASVTRAVGDLFGATASAMERAPVCAIEDCEDALAWLEKART